MAGAASARDILSLNYQGRSSGSQSMGFCEIPPAEFDKGVGQWRSSNPFRPTMAPQTAHLVLSNVSVNILCHNEF